MKTTHISFRNEQITPNFNIYEFYVAANPDQEFDIHTVLIVAAQLIRDWVGFACTVTSTYRPNDTFGFHRYGKAIDIISNVQIHGKPAVKTPAEILLSFKQECLKYINDEDSILIEDLRKIGITGFGVEANCIHLDCRDNIFNHSDKYGGYEVFEFRHHYFNGKMIIDTNKGL